MPDDPAPDPVDDDAGTGGTDDDPAGGDAPTTLEAANAALERERKELAEVRKEASKRRTRERELERELETLKTQGLSDAEKAIADAKRAGADERDAEWRDRYLREAVTAAAGGKLRDPDDAFGLLEAAGVLGELRELEPERMRDGARSHVDKLLEAKPYLGADGNELAGRTAGALTAGVRGRRESGSGGDGDDSDWLRRASRKRSKTT